MPRSSGNGNGDPTAHSPGPRAQKHKNTKKKRCKTHIKNGKQNGKHISTRRVAIATEVNEIKISTAAKFHICLVLNA